MPVTSQQLKRSSMDQLLELLADLDEEQMDILLQEANSTVTGNIEVAKGIDFFERPVSVLQQPPHSPPASPRIRTSRQFITSLSPRNQSELRRLQNNRLSSGPEPRPRDDAGDRPIPSTPQRNMSRGYKRISRPWGMPSPSANADLRDLLAAYLSGVSISSSSASSSSSAATSPASAQAPFAPNALLEPESPGLDLMEPSPLRSKRSVAAFGKPLEEPTHNIGGIFEMLSDSRRR